MSKKLKGRGMSKNLLVLVLSEDSIDMDALKDRLKSFEKAYILHVIDVDSMEDKAFFQECGKVRGAEKLLGSIKSFIVEEGLDAEYFVEWGRLIEKLKMFCTIYNVDEVITGTGDENILSEVESVCLKDLSVSFTRL